MKTIFALAAAAGLAFSAPASAVTYFFDLSGGYTANWTLDSSPTPNVVDAESFILWDVPGSFPDAVAGIVDLTFYTSAFLGGMTILDFVGGVTLVDSTGSQLFSGSVAAPTFMLGTYELFDFDGREYVLVISDGTGGVIPEPATWGLMIAGFGLVGATMRRRRAVEA